MKFPYKTPSRLLALLVFLGSAAPAQAQVSVKLPWVRATVPSQQATGAFMQLSSRQDVTLVMASSPVAGVVEVHEMKMENDIMTMRPVTALALAAGQTVEFKSGGYHLMMMDLKKQIKTGDEVALTLVFENAQGKRETVAVKAVAGLVKPSK